MKKTSGDQEKQFQERIEYKGDLAVLLKQVSKDFHLGELNAYKVIPVGYEDLNLALETDKGKFFVKVLSKDRDQGQKERYKQILEKVTKKGIAHPTLYKSNQGYLHKIILDGVTTELFVMKFINGKTFYDLKRSPSQKEIRFLASQAALINNLDLKPSFVYDSWAEVNILEEYKKVESKLSRKDKPLVLPVVDLFRNVDFDKLPHSFVHGDIIDTNVMKDKMGNLWILDFSVSNYYPRIQEIAVLACDLLTDPTSLGQSLKNLGTALKEYQKKIKLTKEELEILLTYIKGAHAMHVIGATKYLGDKAISKENEYWLKRGREGLTLTRNWI